LSGWRTTSCCVLAGVAISVGLSACGGGTRQDANEPSGNFPVAVDTATFPSSQRLAQHSRMVITVKNTGSKAIPDIAVTITDPKWGTSVQAFGQHVSMAGLASHSRPVWIVDHAPDPGGKCGFSCSQGGPGGAATAYANTWALGRLAPGHSAKFIWAVTAVAPGKYTLHYRIAAGLNGKAKATLVGGGVPQGTFEVNISRAPAQSYVTGSGKIVQTGGSTQQ
jgi:hypothetical protein